MIGGVTFSARGDFDRSWEILQGMEHLQRICAATGRLDLEPVAGAERPRRAYTRLSQREANGSISGIADLPCVLANRPGNR